MRILTDCKAVAGIPVYRVCPLHLLEPGEFLKIMN
jgi:hypothetical protein